MLCLKSCQKCTYVCVGWTLRTTMTRKVRKVEKRVRVVGKAKVVWGLLTASPNQRWNEKEQREENII